MGDSFSERLFFGKMEHGCKHYKRRCRIRAPCCNDIFPCRHCHNEAMNTLSHVQDRHEICRHDVKQVICSVCDTEQEVAQICSNCGVSMGEYFCKICKFYDDDISKGQFHCHDCGICRVGGKENYFHCQKCGSCYALGFRGNHVCVENSMRHDCPICYEYLFDSLKSTTIMRCGHTMHVECYDEMLEHGKYSCPICSKSVTDMSKVWKRIDEEIAATIMPDDYRYKKVWILCNDCNYTTEVPLPRNWTEMLSLQILQHTHHCSTGYFFLNIFFDSENYICCLRINLELNSLYLYCCFLFFVINHELNP